MKKSKMIRENIDLPEKTVKGLEQLGKEWHMKVKPFMELILIDYAEPPISQLRQIKSPNNKKQ